MAEQTSQEWHDSRGCSIMAKISNTIILLSYSLTLDELELFPVDFLELHI